MVRRIILVSISALIVTATGLAQASNQDTTIGELQRQLDEMRSQMVKMQNRIAELEAARGITATYPSADPVLLQSCRRTPRARIHPASHTTRHARARHRKKGRLHQSCASGGDR